MSAANKILQEIKDKDVQYVDLRFTDTRGRVHHVTFDIGMVDEDFLEEGTMFDGSSIAGWKAINESDMLLKPDLSSAYIDPFYQQTTLFLFCDVLNPDTAEPYNRDSRSMAKKALAYVQSSGVGDTVFFGPEAEFFVFDDVRWNTAPHDTRYSFDSSELPANTGAEYAEGNLGHRPSTKGGYFPVNPVDSGQDLRGEMLAVMRDLGLDPEKHHHEVAPAQHELGLKFSDLLTMADRMQLYKYVIHNVAHAYGKSATFMAKPMFGDNGSGMHVHMSIWKDGKPQFAGDQYAGLSQECLWYIGGVIKHAKAINAFANSTTNSYKRLVPGYEAPVKLAYSASNRSASIRIPHVTSPKAKRLEARFPDPMGNPYLTFVALLMAGLDGIENRIDPGAAADKNLYDLPPEERHSIPEVAGSLKEALEALDADRAFLKKGGVMDDDFIDAYITLKQEEVARLQLHPHPVEFDMYYSC
ncbi:Glutamine synthetase [Brevundimonas diminuta]|jgi:glutamine synthetase|uniref:Glutamine synthetase n=2 Tax=Brevundimonas TaxID=41275 RepID=A0A246K866_BREDI|nr:MULTISPECIES: type I glutamate--ammonia ligase [Brevundimonas]ASD28253.1 type I glutamate--ammonia ligase [Brevundimonas diminuta]EGF94411.1 glutamine synthetase, type I [Brevundimonas diminuta ATCC 11568]MBD3572391.1 type I glutamate--ammonia ligase [Brevundimonas diminuta]MBD3818766.1 type I glutamate--ammonia ligase [Brevundimonas diminuta]MCZ4107272.1 type I glutamate--ammonia ligase [Brevundimonas diminuta]